MAAVFPWVSSKPPARPKMYGTWNKPRPMMLWGLNSHVRHMRQKGRSGHLPPYSRSPCAQKRPLFLLRSTARYPEMTCEGRKPVRVLQNAITNVQLSFILAGAIPWGAVWHHDPLMMVVMQSSRHRASGAARPSQSDDGDGDEQLEHHLGARQAPRSWRSSRHHGAHRRPAFSPPNR